MRRGRRKGQGNEKWGSSDKNKKNPIFKNVNFS